MRLRAPASRRRPNRLLEELEDSDGFNSRAYSPAESSSTITRSSAEPMQLMDRRLRPAFPPPTKPFNPNLPPAAFPSLPLAGPESNLSAAPQEQVGNASKDAQRQDSVAPNERQVTVLRYRKRSEEDTMDPDDMTLVQLTARESNIENHSRMMGNPAQQTRFPEKIRFSDVHQLMRATIVANMLSESIRLVHGKDIFWPLRILLKTTRPTIYCDLSFVVAIVLEGGYPNILGNLQPQMRRAEAFLTQHRLPIRFLYAFSLGTITEILRTSNSKFAVLPHPPIRSVGAFIAPDLTNNSDRAHQGGWQQSPSAKGFPLGRLRDAPLEDLGDVVVKNSAYKTVTDYSEAPLDLLPSPFLRKIWAPNKPVAEANKTLTECLDLGGGEAVMTMESNAASTKNPRSADAMDICEAEAETGATNDMERSPTDRAISETMAADPADDMAFVFDEKLDIFEEIPSPIRRGLQLSMKPGAAPLSSLRDREFSGYNEDDGYHYGIFYGDEQTEFYPGVSLSRPVANSDIQRAPATTSNSSQANTTKSPETITAPADFTEVFQGQASINKRNWVLNHLLGLGEEIREATLRNRPVQRGGEDVSMSIDWSDPTIQSHTPQTSPDPELLFEKSNQDPVDLSTTATPRRERQASDGYFPRSLRSLPPRYALPRRSLSLQDLEAMEASTLQAGLQAGLQSSPATIVAVPDSSPGILPPYPPRQPLQQSTISRRGRGRPLKRVTIAETPERIQYQEPPSSAATIPMIDPSPGIILPRNYQPPSRNQNRRGQHAGSPRSHATRPRQPSIMCSSSSSTKSSSSTESETLEPPVLKSRSFLHEPGSDPPLASFRPRSNIPEATPTANTTLVVSNKGRDSGYASVRTTLTSHPKPSNKNSKNLGLDAASLRRPSAVFPISAPAFSNIRLPDRAVFDGAPKSAPLPSLSSWNPSYEENARGYRSSYIPTVSSFAASSSNVNPMQQVLQPALHTTHPPDPTQPVHDNASNTKAPGQNKKGAKIVNVTGRHRGGSGGKDLGLLRMQAMERNLPVNKIAMQNDTELPSTLVSSTSLAAEWREGGVEEEQGQNEDGGVGGTRSPSIKSISTISSGGSSGDEEFERQKRIDEENKRLHIKRLQKLDEEARENQRLLVPTAPPPSSVFPPSDDVEMGQDHGEQENARGYRNDSAHESDQNEEYGKSEGQQRDETPLQHAFPRFDFPPFPPWNANAPTTVPQPSATPSPNRPRSRSRFSINAAGQFEVNSLFTHSALSPHRPPRPPGDENTPGIRAPPRKRKWSMVSHDEGEEDGRG